MQRAVFMKERDQQAFTYHTIQNLASLNELLQARFTLEYDESTDAFPG